MKLIYLIVALAILGINLASALSIEKIPKEGCLRIYCLQVEDPVCGERDGETRIFSNKCQMRSINACLPKERKYVPCSTEDGV